MSNSQLNKLKSAIKNGTEVTLKVSSNLIDNSNDETNFLHKLLLSNTQDSKFYNAFGNDSSANFQKLSCLNLYNYEEFFMAYLFLEIFCRE